MRLFATDTPKHGTLVQVSIFAALLALELFVMGNDCIADVSLAAIFPGDCGKPTKSINSNPAYPLTADAAYVLQASVGRAGRPCAVYICDTDSNGTVLAGDALRILKRAVELPVTLTCPACVDSDNTYCNCTKAEMLAKLAEDPNFTNKPTNDVAALIGGCTGVSSDYSVTTAEWTDAVRTITASSVWIHGAYTATSITPFTPCYTTENDPTDCPDTGSGASALFMKFTGNNVGISGFAVKGFAEGLHFAGANGTAGHMTFDRQCDDSITSENTAVGSEVRQSSFTRGCDKCTQDEAGPTIGSCSGRSCYHNAYYSNSFVGCETPIRFSNTAENGRFLVQGNEFFPDVVGTVAWPCLGSDMGAINLVTTTTGNEINGCKSGIELGGGTHSINGSGLVVWSEQRGVLAKGSGSVSVRDTVIANNGGQTSATPTGGAVAWNSASLDLGTAASHGNNCIYSNEKGGGAARQITNAAPGLALSAQYNWWNNGGAAPPSSELVVERLCSGDTTKLCQTNTDCSGVGTCQNPSGSIDVSNPLGTKPAYCP